MSRVLDFFLTPPEPPAPSPATVGPAAPARPAVSPGPPAPAARVSPLAPVAGAPLGPYVPPAHHPGRRPRKRRGRGSEARRVAPAPHTDFTAMTGAAVLGRPREAEPVAAALALVLRRETRSKTATVAVIGPPLPEASGGGGAGRRIAAKLEAQGLEPRVRGRLVWVRLDPAAPDLASLAWQVTLLAAPVVFAVTSPRTPAIDAALSEQDLVVLVTGDPDGALAAAAVAGLGQVVTARPLARGLGRELSRAGVRPAASIRALLDTEGRR